MFLAKVGTAVGTGQENQRFEIENLVGLFQNCIELSKEFSYPIGTKESMRCQVRRFNIQSRITFRLQTLYTTIVWKLSSIGKHLPLIKSMNFMETKTRPMHTIVLFLIFGTLFSPFPNFCHALDNKSMQATETPAIFQPLYAELAQQLTDAESKVRSLADSQHKRPIMAPSLYLASSFFGPAEPGTERWQEIMTALDGFQALGVNAVSLMISFPDLTAELKDPEPLLHFYELLAAEVRRRNMKLLVEHFVYPPSAPTKEGKFVAALKNIANPKLSFLNWKKEEVKLILSRVKPDYFSLISEPETYDRFLGISITAEDYSRWLNDLIDELTSCNGKNGVKIGAGAGIWESEDYAQVFSRVKGLDYIDIHFYPLKLKSEDLVGKLLALIDQIKATDKSKEIVMSEMWLYKHGMDEAKGVFNTEAYGRNAYDFWVPLDIRFLELINEIARKKGISVISPYFPQFFFALGKYDPAIFVSWPASMLGEWKLAIEAILKHKLSPTGNSFKVLNNRGKSTEEAN